MPEVVEEGELPAGIDEAWRLVGDFAGMVRALGAPVEVEGEGIGQTRSITMGDSVTVERLEERDEAARRLVYSIVSAPFPLVDYLSTMQLRAAGPDRTHLQWSSTFGVAPGATEEEACSLVRAIYQGGIAGLQKQLSG